MTERDGIALKTALASVCPRCGEGTLFAGPLTLTLFGIPILGFLVLGAAFLVEFKVGPPILVHILLWGPVTFALAFLLLRLVKATLIALQYRHAAGEGRVDRE